MIIAEFRLDHPILRESLARAPETTVIHERSDAIDDSRVRILFWAEGGDLERFEAALEGDPTVEPPTKTIRFGDRRLYQTELTGVGLETSIYPTLVEEGGIIHELRATHEGWEFRAAFPERSSFDSFHEFCRAHDITFHFHRLYTRQEAVGNSERAFGLTDPQREILLAAVEAGYFEIPREVSLAELAERFGVTGNAASERLRRGMKRLIVGALSPTDDDRLG